MYFTNYLQSRNFERGCELPSEFLRVHICPSSHNSHCERLAVRDRNHYTPSRDVAITETTTQTPKYPQPPRVRPHISIHVVVSQLMFKPFPAKKLSCNDNSHIKLLPKGI